MIVKPYPGHAFSVHGRDQAFVAGDPAALPAKPTLGLRAILKNLTASQAEKVSPVASNSPRPLEQEAGGPTDTQAEASQPPVHLTGAGRRAAPATTGKRANAKKGKDAKKDGGKKVQVALVTDDEESDHGDPLPPTVPVCTPPGHLFHTISLL